jgi:mannose-6-phosphate isomerase-like protein (cupin superfamily)
LVSSWAFLNEKRKSAPHKHQAKEIYFFTRGEGVVQVGQKKVSVKAGDAVYIPSNTLHHAGNVGESDLEYICISFGLNAPSLFIKILGLLYKSLPIKGQV